MLKTSNTKILLAIIILLNACNPAVQKEAGDEKKETKPLSYTKNDLKKIKWIEGKWRGMAGDKPFYEIYEMINDSCLQITTYDWNGKDSSNSDVDFVVWKDDAYWLGKNQNYKTTEITDTEIKMIPVKASNDIRWIFKDSSSWDVILTGKKNTLNYHMERFDPFGK